MLPEEVNPWPCPELSPHPPRYADTTMSGIDWREEQPGRLRVVDHTCSCGVIVDELVSFGGRYMIRRTQQTDPPVVLVAGPWARPRAERMWHLLLTG